MAKLNLSAGAGGPEWRDLDLGGGETIRLLLRAPTVEQRLRDQGFAVAGFYGDRPETEAAAYQFRLDSVIAGWAGVEDDAGQPIPFSPDNLRRLIDQFPAALEQLLQITTEAFRPRAAAKN